MAQEPLVIAHRGASAYAPEHTFASWDRALELGADFIELDLQMTRDGELVVLHDEELDRTARGSQQECTGLVRERTLQQIQRCDVGGWFNAQHPDRARDEFVGLAIPTLRQVLERYGLGTRYYAPILGALGALASGETVVTGAPHLKHKESDRIASTVGLIRALGGRAEPLEDGFRVFGGCRLRGTTVSTAGDHRIAMAAGVLALSVPGVTVSDAEAVRKSYPRYFEDLNTLTE